MTSIGHIKNCDAVGHARNPRAGEAWTEGSPNSQHSQIGELGIPVRIPEKLLKEE